MHRHSLAVPQPSVGARVNKPLNVGRYLAPQITLYPVVVRNRRGNLANLFVAQIFHPHVRIDARSFENLIRTRPADAENVCQSDFDPLFPWQVNA
jgi:hypothetical protein